MDLTKAESARFYSQYVALAVADCWEWRGGLFNNGYGWFYLKRGQRKTHAAHRLAWSLWNHQPVPERHMICHTCDNRSCVNPAHLYCGTGYDNNTDTVKRHRATRKMGAACSWSKLTAADVLAIRASSELQGSLAAKYQVDQSTISQIRNRLRWKHLG